MKVKKQVNISEALRLYRVYHDVTLAELSKELGVSLSFISNLEHGRRNPNMETLKKYSKAFETTPSRIMAFAEGVSAARQGMGRLRLFAETLGIIEEKP